MFVESLRGWMGLTGWSLVAFGGHCRDMLRLPLDSVSPYFARWFHGLAQRSIASTNSLSFGESSPGHRTLKRYSSS